MRASATRRTSFSLLTPVADQLRDGDEREVVLLAKPSRSGRRAISDLSVGHDLAQHAGGRQPAARHRSTVASVWPARLSTPPAR